MLWVHRESGSHFGSWSQCHKLKIGFLFIKCVCVCVGGTCMYQWPRRLEGSLRSWTSWTPPPLQPPCDRVTSICEKPDEGPGAQFSISDSAGTFLSHLSSLSYSGFYVFQTTQSIDWLIKRFFWTSQLLMNNPKLWAKQMYLTQYSFTYIAFVIQMTSLYAGKTTL